MNNTESTHYYGVHHHKCPKPILDYLIEKSVVAIGWLDTDFSQMTPDQVRDHIRERGHGGRRANWASHFRAIKKGDVIIVPAPYVIYIATAIGEATYSKTGQPEDLANHQRVEYLKENGQLKKIPRSSLSRELQTRLGPGSRGRTVFKLDDFKEEIKDLLEGQDWDQKHADKSIKEEVKFKERLLDKIRGREGGTGMKAGGIGLEHLVVELLKIEGYKNAKVMSKRGQGPGDVDVEGTKEIKDRFASEDQRKVCVQVKHHHWGKTGTHGLHQLEEAKKGIEEKDNVLVKWVLLSTGTFDENVVKDADELDIQLIDGEKFIDWLYQHIHDLDSKTKAKLGILDVPSFMDE